MNVTESSQRHEFIAEAWDKTRLEFFALAICIENIIASSPPQRRTLTALLTENIHVLDREWEDLLVYWLEACCDEDERISSQARASFLQVENQEIIDAVCRIAWQSGDSHAVNASIEGKYIPSLPIDRCLFFFATCQWTLLEAEGDSSVHLTNIYHSDELSDKHRHRFLEIAVKHSRMEFVKAMTRNYSKNAISILTETERRSAIMILLKNSDWKNLCKIIQSPTVEEIEEVCSYFVSRLERIPEAIWPIVYSRFNELSPETREQVAGVLVDFIEYEEPFTEWDKLRDILMISDDTICEEHWEELTKVGLHYSDHFFCFAAAIPILHGINSLMAIRGLLDEFESEVNEILSDEDQLLTELMNMLPYDQPEKWDWALPCKQQRHSGGSSEAYEIGVLKHHPVVLKPADQIDTNELHEILKNRDHYKTQEVRSLADCILAFVTWARIKLHGSEIQQEEKGAYILLTDEPECLTNEEPSQEHLSTES